MIVWRDGEFIEAQGAVSAADRGYLVGDAVFETFLVENGRPAFFDRHFARLLMGASSLAMRVTLDAGTVRNAIAALSARAGPGGRAACRLTLSRTGGARGLVPPADARTQLVISLAQVAAPPTEVRVIVATSRRYAAAATNAFKCAGAYAPNLLARMEAAQAGASEAIMLNEYGRVASATAANVFLMEKGRLITPPESEGAMPGVTRASVLDAARALGIAVEIEPIDAGRIAGAALILTNSLIGVAAAGPHDADAARLVTRLRSAYESRLQNEFAERDS